MRKHIARFVSLMLTVAMALPGFAASLDVRFSQNTITLAPTDNPQTITATIRNTRLGQILYLNRVCLELPAGAVGANPYYTVSMAKGLLGVPLNPGQSRIVNLTITPRRANETFEFNNKLIINPDGGSLSRRVNSVFKVRVRESANTTGEVVRLISSVNLNTPIEPTLGLFNCQQSTQDGSFVCDNAAQNLSTGGVGTTYPTNDTFLIGSKLMTVGTTQYIVFVTQSAPGRKLTMCPMTSTGTCDKGNAIIVAATVGQFMISLDVVNTKAYMNMIAGNTYKVCDLQGLAGSSCSDKTLTLVGAGSGAELAGVIKADPINDDVLYVYTERGANTFPTVQKCSASSGACTEYYSSTDTPALTRSNSFAIKTSAPARFAAANRFGDPTTGSTDVILECDLGGRVAENCLATRVADGSDRRIKDLRYDDDNNRLYVLFQSASDFSKNGIAYFTLDSNGHIENPTGGNYVLTSNNLEFFDMQLLP